MKHLLYLIFLINLFFVTVQAKYTIMTNDDALETTSVLIPIEDIFEGKCISRNGCIMLDEIISKIANENILIEVFCSTTTFHNYSWETGNMYGYKISKRLIEKGFDPHKIRYIGYGELGNDEQKMKNIIKISILKPETMWLIN